MHRLFALFMAGFFIFCSFTAVQAAGQLLPRKEKRTVLGKYVTAQEAHDMWMQNPETISILDVRSPAEYFFVGHAPMAVNIPVIFYEWDDVKGTMNRVDNIQFESQVAKRFEKDQTLLVMCRSGGRGSEAVNRLANMGFVDVYNITDGFEGDKVKDKRSVFKGKRYRNGWKNTLSIWTYELDPEHAYKK